MSEATSSGTGSLPASQSRTSLGHTPSFWASRPCPQAMRRNSRLSCAGVNVSSVMGETYTSTWKATRAVASPERERRADSRPPPFPETILFPKQGQDVLLERLGELTGRVGLQMQRHITCVHISTPWLLRREPT